MPLDDLVDVIETLQRRIRDHGTTLRANETRTRLALIDPLLTALGWDVSDPALVTPEYRVDVGWADYALRGQGNQPAAVIEAKRLGSIVENHLEQSVGYCIQQGIAYAGVTDGNHWQLYRTFEPVPMEQKLVLDIHIANTPAHELALQLLLLWRPNLASGQPVAAREPLVGLTPIPQPAAPTPAPPEAPAIIAVPQPEPVEMNTSPAGWVSLAEYNRPGGSPPPAAIRFPGKREIPITRWTEILLCTAEWLYAQGTLRADNVPVRSNSRKRYVINTIPIHPNGDPFGRSAIVDGAPFLVSINLNAGQVRRYTKILLEHCGVDPSTVQLQMSE